MATSRPFAYTTSSPPSPAGTQQYGNVVVGIDPTLPYAKGYGGLKWWNGGDEDLGYVIAKAVPSGVQPNPDNITCNLGLSHTKTKTDSDFLGLVRYLIGDSAYNSSVNGSTSLAVQYLNNNGYWTSYTTNMIVYYDFSNTYSYPGSGTSVTDLKSNSNGDAENTSFSSSNGGILQFNGSNSYLTTLTDLTPDLNSSSKSDISLFAWVYPKGNGVILSEQGTTYANTSWYDSQIEMVSGVLKFSVWNYAGVITSSISTPLNNWYYVGIVYDSSTTTLTAYVNGSSAGSTSFTRQAPYQYGYQLYYNLGYSCPTNLGNGGWGNFNLGTFEVYNTPLLSSDVLSKYNSSKSRFGL